MKVANPDNSLDQIKNYKKRDFMSWIESDISEFGNVKTEYEQARSYYENVQVPTNTTKKSNIEYVTENLITDLINSLVGQLLGGMLLPSVTGGGELGYALKELTMDIVERNKFMLRHAEPASNMFYVEGLSWLYTIFNPFKWSPYGIGMPVIYTGKPNEFYLDCNNKGFMREDDLRRTNEKRILVEYAEKKYPNLKGKIKPTAKTSKGKGSGETEKWCDLHTIEFRVPDIVAISELADGRTKEKLRSMYDETTKIETDWFYQVEMINQTEIGKEPELTGFNRFRMVPLIHTPRIQEATYPFGASLIVKGKQDQINMTGTTALEAVKADIKNLIVLVGGNVDDEQKYRTEASKTNGIIVLPRLDGKAIQMRRQPISPAMMEWYAWQRRAFDEMIGHRYSAEKGAASGSGLSGKAIGILDQREGVPEIVKKLHLEYGFTEMLHVILECIGNKMNQQQFKITRNVDGKETDIYFNTPLDKSNKMKIDDKYNVMTDNVINDLTQIDIDEIDLSLNIDMDKVGKEAQEQNKALIAQERGIISSLDATKKLYPREWQEISDNLAKENMAIGLIQKIIKLGPEVLQQIAQTAENVDQFVQDLETAYAKNNQAGPAQPGTPTQPQQNN